MTHDDFLNIASARGFKFSWTLLNDTVTKAMTETAKRAFTLSEKDAIENAQARAKGFVLYTMQEWLQLIHGLDLVVAPHPYLGKTIFYYNCYDEKTGKWIIPNSKEQFKNEWGYEHALKEGLYDVLLNHVK